LQTTSSPYVPNLTAVASPSAYGTFPPTVIPGLISTTDQLSSNFGLVSAPSALIASNKSIRTDRLEVLLLLLLLLLSPCFWTLFQLNRLLLATFFLKA